MQEEAKLTQSFKTLNIIYIALGVGMLVSCAVFVFLVISSDMVVNPELSDVLMIVVPVLASSTFVMGKFLYNANAKKSKEEVDSQKRFTLYQSSCLIVWAMLEGSGIFASISYLQTGNLLFLVFFAFIFLGYLFNKPSLIKFQQDF